MISFNNINKTFLLVLLINSIAFPLFSQELGLIQSKYYSTDDYNSGTQNWAIVQDKRGLMYFGNAFGVMEFDGENWKLFKVKNESTVRSLAADNNGTIYVGAYGEIGMLLPNSKGVMRYNSLMNLIDTNYTDFREIWDINCFGDTVFFLSDKYLFKFVNGKFSYIKSKSKGFYLSYNVKNNYLIQELGIGLMRMQNDSLTLINGGEFFSDITIHAVFNFKNGYLVCSRKKGLFYVDNSTKNPTIKPISSISSKANRVNNYFIENSFYHGIALSNNLFALSSISGDLLIIDSDWNVKDIIDHRTIGIKSPTLYLYSHNGQNLWLALDNGICQVEIRSPYRYWNESVGINGILSDVARVGEYFYISTGSGIFYTRKNQAKFEINSFNPVEGIFEQAWGFQYFQPPLLGVKNLIRSSNDELNFVPDNNTLLLVATRTGVHQITGPKSTKIAEYDAVNCLHQSRKNPNKLFLGLNNGLAELEYKNRQWNDKGIKYLKEESIRDIGEDSLGNLWIIPRYNGVYRMRNSFLNDTSLCTIEHYDTTSGINNMRYLRIFDLHNPLLFIGNRNLYTFNDSLKQFDKFNFTRTNLTDEQKAKRLVDSLTNLRVADAVLTDDYVTHHNDSVVWFSTKQGVFSQSNSPFRDFNDVPPAIIRKVICGDSLFFGGTNFYSVKSLFDTLYPVTTESVIDLTTILKARNNSITFHYAWPFFEGEKKNLYSYFLQGYDNQWSNWRTELSKEYTNLPEGSYSFKVKAKNLYGIESPVAEFKFSVLPPWYRTYYAYLSYFVLSILFILLIVKLYTYKLIIEKNKLEQLVKERTQEILIQNEEILVQAEHLKDANDWISAKNVELEAQKEEIEKKKDELELSNATKNKFFRIIAHDLRNPISTLVNSTSYILTDFDEFDKQKTKRIIEELNKLSHTTYNLLENLLDWSTNQMGDLPFNPKQVNLRSVIQDNVELVSTKVNAKGINLTLSVPESINVIADENMLYTVVRNILTNAVKFTKDNGSINIYTKTDDYFCYLCIADNGVGISPDRINKLFRIDKDVVTAGTHNEKGSGLGLILSKEFIERNGGKITVESELEKGSTFTISLKLA